MKRLATQLIFVLVFVKILSAGLHSFSPFVHPHIKRQSDTLGLSLRYWLRWSVEEDQFNPLVPALLSSGDSRGISPTEFPLLNLITAPAFSLSF